MIYKFIFYQKFYMKLEYRRNDVRIFTQYFTVFRSFCDNLIEILVEKHFYIHTSNTQL